eukprot:s1314_g12.t1
MRTIATPISDVSLGLKKSSATHHLTLYKASSGALVFGAGTVQWAWGLDNFHDAVTGMNNMWESEYNTRIGVDPSGPDPVVQQATLNLFADMGVEAPILGAGMVRPSRSTDKDAPVVTSVSTTMKGTQKSLVAQAADSAGEVAAVEWSADGRSWHPMKRDLSKTDQWIMEMPQPRGRTMDHAAPCHLEVGLMA